MATPPTFVAEFETAFNINTTPKTVSVTVAAGDTLVVIGASEDGSCTLGTPTGGGLTYTLQQSVVVGSYTTVYLWTAPCPTSQTFTLSVAATGGLQFGLNALRFSGSAGIGNSAKTNVVSGGPSLALTTTGANSAIVVVSADWAALATARTWRTVNSITPASGSGEVTYAATGNYTAYGAYYSDAGTAGSKTVGLSAPTGQKYSIIAVEVLGTAGATTVNGTAAMSAEGTLTANPTVVTPDTGTLTGAGTVTAAGTIRVTATASLAGTGTLTASSGGAVLGTASLIGAGTVTAASTVVVPAAASLPASGTLAATGAVRLFGAATLTGAGALAGASGAAVNGAAALAGGGTIAGATAIGKAGTAALSGSGTLTAPATVRVFGDAVLVGAGSLAAIGGGRVFASAALAGSAVFSAAGTASGQLVTRPDTGTTGRPATGTITRPDTGTVVHILTVVVRLYTGTISRP